MGRKVRRAVMRANKRAREAQTELLETAAAKVETKAVEAKADEELFTIDTQADSRKVGLSKNALAREKKRKARLPSTKEKREVKRLLATHSKEKLRKLVLDGKKRANRAKNKGKVKANFDLWDEDDSGAGASDAKKRQAKSSSIVPAKDKATKSPLVQSTIGTTLAGIKPDKHTADHVVTRLAHKSQHDAVAIDVAKSGQSYNPDKVEHKKIIEAAVEVEMRRDHAENQRKAPISTGMSEETKALLLSDSDSDSDDDDGNDNDDEKNENGDGSADQLIQLKKKEKMTRAERNKQKRLRQEEKEMRQRKKQKKLMNSVAEAKTISKKLRKEAATKAADKARVEALKASTQRKRGKDVIQQISQENPIGAPTMPVALSTDVKAVRTGGGLRGIKPKGSLITDRMVSFSDRDMSAKKALKKNKKVQGKRRKTKVKIHGKGHKAAKEGHILG